MYNLKSYIYIIVVLLLILITMKVVEEIVSRRATKKKCNSIQFCDCDHCIVCDRYIPDDELTAFSNINGVVYRTCRLHSISELNEAVKRMSKGNKQ